MPRAADMPTTRRRPSRYKHLTYNGKLGEVIGISDVRSKNGGTIYEVKCADCGETHLRTSKEIQLEYRSRECKTFKQYNYSGLEKWDTIIRRVYGITLDQYNTMLAEQGGGCAICGSKTDVVETRRLAIDHCHKTNVVRGILCTKCNQGIGSFNDDVVLLENAKSYLTKFATAR